MLTKPPGSCRNPLKPMLVSARVRLVVLLLALSATVGCDQTSKHLARTHLGRFGSIELPNGWGELRVAENPGSFLSLGATMPRAWRLGLLTFGVTASMMLLFGYLARSPNLRWLVFTGLVLIWCGGSSNLIDRFTRDGMVTDFVFLRLGPLHTGVFNIADVLIMAGLFLLVGDACRERSHRKAKAALTV